MRPPKKGEFWYQTSDAAMHKRLFILLAIGVIAGVMAWFVGHGLLRALIHH